MSSKLLLRIAAGILFLHLFLHSIGHNSWQETKDPIKQGVINQMVDHKFYFMGTDRSMGDYFIGYGYIVTLALGLTTVLLLFISNALNESKQLNYKILMAISVALVIWSVDEFVFFFPFAAGITLLAAVCTGFAAVKLR